MTTQPTEAPHSGQVRFDFTDRVVVVTGASGGIGSAVADMFAEAGADVVLHGRNEQALADGVRRAQERGRSAVAVTGNIRSPETASDIVSTAVQRFGRIDILVNNAGGNFAARMTDLSPNAWDATIDANLSGAFYLAQACHPVLLDNGGGVVVNVGSKSAQYAHPLRGAYAAAKAGLASVTRSMAWEWAEANIRVNCVEPGAVTTESSRFAAGDVEDEVSRYIALGRVGLPRDIANVCLFLSSDAAAYVTGETLVVAGGTHTSTPADADLVRQRHDAE